MSSHISSCKRLNQMHVTTEKNTCQKQHTVCPCACTMLQGQCHTVTAQPTPHHPPLTAAASGALWSLPRSLQRRLHSGQCRLGRAEGGIEEEGFHEGGLGAGVPLHEQQCFTLRRYVCEC